MGKMERDKGARGEREVIALLQPVMDKVCDATNNPRIVLRRNADQRFAAKQYDLIGIPWIALEVKRVENMSGLLGWWRQTLAATGDKQVPVLIYRGNNMPWRIRMKVKIVAGNGRKIKATITVDMPTFLLWFEHFLLDRLPGSTRI